MPLIVNGETVNDSAIRQEAAALRPRFAEMVQGEAVETEMQLREWAREAVIEKTLLRQEALKDPEPIPEALIQEALEQPGCITRATDDLRRDIEVRLRIDRLIRKIGEKAPRSKQRELVDYYRKNRDQFFTPEMLRVSHIVKNVNENTDEAGALEVIRRAQEELRQGEPFAQVADRYSDCAGNGGDLGYFPRGQMVQEFEDVVFALKTGETSDIFRTVFGFHIARLEDRKPEGIRSLDEVREQIEAVLLRDKQQRALDEFLGRLKAKADIQIVRRRGGEA